MKYFFIATFFTFSFTLSTFAAEAKWEWKHTPHPPHDHHNSDHLKYIRKEEKSLKKQKLKTA